MRVREQERVLQLLLLLAALVPHVSSQCDQSHCNDLSYTCCSSNTLTTGTTLGFDAFSEPCGEPLIGGNEDATGTLCFGAANGGAYDVTFRTSLASTQPSSSQNWLVSSMRVGEPGDAAGNCGSTLDVCATPTVRVVLDQDVRYPDDDVAATHVAENCELVMLDSYHYSDESAYVYLHDNAVLRIQGSVEWLEYEVRADSGSPYVLVDPGATWILNDDIDSPDDAIQLIMGEGSTMVNDNNHIRVARLIMHSASLTLQDDDPNMTVEIRDHPNAPEMHLFGTDVLINITSVGIVDLRDNVDGVIDVSGAVTMVADRLVVDATASLTLRSGDLHVPRIIIEPTLVIAPYAALYLSDEVTASTFRDIVGTGTISTDQGARVALVLETTVSRLTPALDGVPGVLSLRNVDITASSGRIEVTIACNGTLCDSGSGVVELHSIGQQTNGFDVVLDAVHAINPEGVDLTVEVARVTQNLTWNEGADGLSYTASFGSQVCQPFLALTGADGDMQRRWIIVFPDSSTTCASSIGETSLDGLADPCVCIGARPGDGPTCALCQGHGHVVKDPQPPPSPGDDGDDSATPPGDGDAFPLLPVIGAGVGALALLAVVLVARRSSGLQEDPTVAGRRGGARKKTYNNKKDTAADEEDLTKALGKAERKSMFRMFQRNTMISLTAPEAAELSAAPIDPQPLSAPKPSKQVPATSGSKRRGTNKSKQRTKVSAGDAAAAAGKSGSREKLSGKEKHAEKKRKASPSRYVSNTSASKKSHGSRGAGRHGGGGGDTGSAGNRGGKRSAGRRGGAEDSKRSGGGKRSAAAAATGAAAGAGATAASHVASDAIPTSLIEALYYVEDKGQLEEGIFRISGTHTAAQELLRRIQEAPKHFDTSSEPDVHDVASAVKQFIRQMDPRVVPVNCIEAIATALAAKKMALLHTALKKLPKPHFDLLRRLSLICSNLAEKEAVNKMGSEQLATVLGPNLVDESSMGTGVALLKLCTDRHQAVFHPTKK